MAMAGEVLHSPSRSSRRHTWQQCSSWEQQQQLICLLMQPRQQWTLPLWQLQREEVGSMRCQCQQQQKSKQQQQQQRRQRPWWLQVVVMMSRQLLRLCGSSPQVLGTFILCFKEAARSQPRRCHCHQQR